LPYYFPSLDICSLPDLKLLVQESPYDMMFANDVHCARLGALFTHLLHEPHFASCFEFAEIGIYYAVLVEIDQAAIQGLDLSITLFGKKLGDPSVR
jgi:hypothetical protein